MLSKLAAKIKRIIYRASKVLNNAGTVVIMAIVLLITADVLLRNILNMPIQGSVEIVEYLMVVLIFFLFANGQMQKTNVNVDMLVKKLPAKVRKYLEAFNYLLASVFYMMVTVQMLRESYDVYTRYDVSPSLSIPEYPFFIGASIGVLFLTLVLIVDFLAIVLNVQSEEKEKLS